MLDFPCSQHFQQWDSTPEWRRGSTWFGVWQQNRFADEPMGERVGPRAVWRALSARGSNYLALKMNYWLPVR